MPRLEDTAEYRGIAQMAKVGPETWASWTGALKGLRDAFLEVTKDAPAGSLLRLAGVGVEPTKRTAEQDLEQMIIDYGIPNVAGVFAGKGALTADLAKLKIAKKDIARPHPMTKVKREDVRGKTGWFKGKYDPKWRFEIADEKMKFDKKVFKWLKEDKQVVMLEDLIQHPELFAAYPQLKKVRVHPRPGTDASWRNDQSVIRAGMEGDVRDSLLHEIQHAIQDFERFPRGGSASEFAPSASYMNRAETRAQLASDLLDIKRHADKIGMSYEAALKEHNLPQFGLFDNARFLKYSDSEDMLSKTVDEHLYLRQMEEKAGERYENLAGEIEARNVAGRGQMTPKERITVPPFVNAPKTAEVRY